MRTCALTLLLTACACVWASEEARLARDGKALMPVMTAEKASERVRKAAGDLADVLGKMSGAKFEVTSGDGTNGIAVGVADDFPKLALKDKLTVKGVADREAYVLRSHPRGLHVIGATDLAVEDAVWDLLWRFGFRQFFPGKTWEVIPSAPDLRIAVDDLQRPDYYARRIWYGFGPWDYSKEPYEEWCLRNRARLGFELRTGHAYDGLIRANKAAFEKNPEFYGLLKGERKSSKLCIGNPDLRKLIVSHALRTLEEEPEADSISMDPSDGGGWCECEPCAKLGSVTDRALTLANEVADAVSQKHKGKFVGMYAYSYHSPPPNIRVHPNVIISVACGFIKGGFTVDQLVSGWQAKGAAIGIREYYSVNTWDRDMPGKARGGNLDYLARTIPDFHAKGARFLSSESSDNWGPNGLGYYVAARLLWDVDEAKRAPELVDDFLTRAFGPAKAPMAEFYKLLDASKPWLVFDDLLGRMYRHLAEAKKLAPAPEIHARINDLILYARYVELYGAYADAKGEARQPAFEALIRHAYRMRKTMMVHTKALYRDLVSRDKNVSIPEGATWDVPEGKNPWKSSEPFSEPELTKFVTDGIAHHPLAEINFRPVKFSEDLVPATKLNLPEVKLGQLPAGRGLRAFYTWVSQAPSAVELKVTGGLIAHYRDRGNVKIDLWQIGGASETGERETHVAHDESVPPDGVERTVKLRAKETGLHKVTLNDGNDLTLVSWAPGTLMTILSTLDSPAQLGSRWDLCFYVPKGTKVVGLYADGLGSIQDGSGKTVFTFDGHKAGFHSLPVAPGQDGALWRFVNSTGTRRLMTVPPCLARSGAELLLPREVVEPQP